MAIEPVTREERFLAVAGGQSVTPPEPITRKEKLLKGIIDAVNSGGGNGSGGNVENGEDGFSPIATVTQTATGAVISITDKNGRTTATITNGKDGATGPKPVKGVDYWTEADQESIVQQVITALGTPVFGRVEEGNKITFSTEHLADGTYYFGYEDKDGNWVEIGTLNNVPAPTYTNILLLAINSDGTPYNGGQGWKTDTRLSSSGSESTSNASGIEVTGFIPVIYGDILYLKNIEMIRQGANADKCYVTVYNSAFVKLGDWRLDFTTDYAGFVFDGNNNLVQINVIDNGGFSGGVSDAAYLRFSATEIDSTSIVTKNQPIE